LFAGRINIARVYLSFAGHALFSDSRMFLECSFRGRDWGLGKRIARMKRVVERACYLWMQDADVLSRFNRPAARRIVGANA